MVFIASRCVVHGSGFVAERANGLEHRVVRVAIGPGLAWLIRADHRVARGVMVLGRVSIRRLVATADMAALEAQSQVDPNAAAFEALLATLSAGPDAVFA